jgi:hypothetical protein
LEPARLGSSQPCSPEQDTYTWLVERAPPGTGDAFFRRKMARPTTAAVFSGFWTTVAISAACTECGGDDGGRANPASGVGGREFRSVDFAVSRTELLDCTAACAPSP